MFGATSIQPPHLEQAPSSTAGRLGNAMRLHDQEMFNTLLPIIQQDFVPCLCVR